MNLFGRLASLLYLASLIGCLLVQSFADETKKDYRAPLQIGAEYSIVKSLDDGLNQDELQLVSYGAPNFVVLERLRDRKYRIAFPLLLNPRERGRTIVVTGIFAYKKGWHLERVPKKRERIKTRFERECKDAALRKSIRIEGGVGRSGVIEIPEGHRILLDEALRTVGWSNGRMFMQIVFIQRARSPETIEMIRSRDPILLERGDLVILKKRIFD